VENDQKIMKKTDGSEHIWIVCVPLRPVHEGPKPVDLDESEAAEHRVITDGQVKKVKRQEAQAVDVESG